MAFTDTGRKAEGHGANASTSVATLNSTVAGNMIVVCCSSWNSSAHTLTCSDNVNGSYGTAIVTQTAASNRVAIWVFPNGAGGNLTITVTASLGSSYIWVGAHEFAGGPASSPLSGSTGNTSGSSTTGSSGTATPADNDPLFVAVVSYGQVGTITENQGAQGFTLSNEYEDTGTSLAQPGSMVFKIVSGASGGQAHTWAFNPTASWVGCIAAFKPGASTPVYTQTKFRVYDGSTGTGLGEPA